jgi:hypothetical protein
MRSPRIAGPHDEELVTRIAARGFQDDPVPGRVFPDPVPGRVFPDPVPGRVFPDPADRPNGHPSWGMLWRVRSRQERVSWLRDTGRRVASCPSLEDETPSTLMN